MQCNPARFCHSIWFSEVQKVRGTDTAHLTAGPAVVPVVRGLSSIVPWGWRWTRFTDVMHRGGSARCWSMGISLWLKKIWGNLLIMN